MYCGNYVGEISTIFLKGEVTFIITNNGEKYNIDTKLPSPMDKVKVVFSNIRQEDNSLLGIAKLSIMPKSEIESKITFEPEGKIKASMKVPKLGKVIIKRIRCVSNG